jgi:hypothetical protein
MTDQEIVAGVIPEMLSIIDPAIIDRALTTGLTGLTQDDWSLRLVICLTTWFCPPQSSRPSVSP